jgi:4-alpha-glucanotransferase
VRSVAGLNTHDMPPFASHWEGLDIDARAKLGLVPKKDLGREHASRKRLNQALVKFLRRKGWLKTGDPEDDAGAVLRGCLAWLAAGPAEIVQINLEDLWQEPRPQNVPGTRDEHPNWRRKTQLTIEEIVNSAELREVLGQVDSLRNSRTSK